MQFVIATHNKHKITEFVRILAPMGIEVITADLTEAEENGTTFMENSIIKSSSACKETNLPSIADDSGICVDALDGRPGIYSARYSVEGKQNQSLIGELENVPVEKRGAHYACAISCVFPNGDIIKAEGKCYGKIGFEERGTNGFGYDPIFLIGDKTMAEISDQEKDEISHRAVALREFKNKLEEYLNTH